MDEIEDVRYHSNPYGDNQQQGYRSSSSGKLPVRDVSCSRLNGNQYVDGNEDEEEDDEDLSEEDANHCKVNGDQYVRNYNDGNDNKLYDDDEGSNQKNDDVDSRRHPKKRKLKDLVSSYEFVCRVPAPEVASTSVPKPSCDAWGDRFLQRKRKSLRAEEWQEVAEKVSEVSKIERTDTQCRNRLDTLKKKYKKEKAMVAETGTSTSNSKWVFFKMDMLMSSSPQQGVIRKAISDEMRDSPTSSESSDSEEDVSEGLPPKKRRLKRQCDDDSWFKLLADSIWKFSNVYEKIENSKRVQMLELENMRMEFHRELEMQKRQILKKLQAEIVKMQEEDNASSD
ncbi:hypothetical protein GOBAR_AA23803 [Gossypium barbadense]|uniref:Myb/SANT-like DNA-binding domain-containing protein n=1 Tax=Gossypium barbadense TaxID=3634 RepID=A0A2P5X0J1_GOSBA|nr:hypothetical protein GOBAR_AA23803 [Gossypium barbadense]